MSEATSNPFTTRRKLEEIPLHSTSDFDEKPMTKSFSLYNMDMTRVENARQELKMLSRTRLSDSLIVRVALAHLDESLQKGGEKVEKEIRRLIQENR